MIYIYRERGFLFKPLKAFAYCLPQKSVLSRVKKHLYQSSIKTLTNDIFHAG